jgi:hypothetical protein
VAKVVEAELLQPGGIVATTLDTGQQWDWPNGWAPLQWIAVAGLTSYGQNRLAETIACRWMVNVSRVYRLTGKLVEKYDVVAGGRGRRISHPRRLWLDQWRDAEADGALSGRRRADQRRSLSGRTRRLEPSAFRWNRWRWRTRPLLWGRAGVGGRADRGDYRMGRCSLVA